MSRKEKAIGHVNQLINESSPYLLQHAHNPVDWYSWGAEAFEKARKEDKPIFLSIGYSTCHWCHVMEKESFENEGIAEIMNEHFVSIKVDREQRPDIDSIYMNVVQMMTGSGGWPLSVFLTPEGKPFFGGTYFPPGDSFGRPGFKKVLLAINDAWRQRRDELEDSAGKISSILGSLAVSGEQGSISTGILEKAYSGLARAFDKNYGGFGQAPKFPQPGNLLFLLNYRYRTGDAKALAMVEQTLEAMSKGGIYDQLGGGFHRYSVDEKWMVPHFEKMLYDQALLSRMYIAAYQVTGKKKYADIAQEIFDYVLRDMTDSNGGFYSAEDADSEGEEGTFYLWRLDEIEKLLGEEKAAIFAAIYGVSKKGNFEHGKNILHVADSVEKIAEKNDVKQEVVDNTIAEGKALLLAYRSKRIRPHRDEKIIAGWNGLMIGSMAYGGAAMEKQQYIDAAKRGAEFVLREMKVQGRLARYWRDDKIVGKGFLDDYAFLTWGLLELYEATYEARWLREAKELAEQMVVLFGDEQGGGFYLSGSDDEQLIMRDKPSYDGAIPSGNSIAALILLKLGKLTVDKNLNEKGWKTLDSFSGQLNESPTAFTTMLLAVDFWLGPTQEIVIAGDSRRSDTREMIRAIQSRFLPRAVTAFHEAQSGINEIEQIIPFIEGQVSIEGKSTAYVCESYVCKKPVTDVNELKMIFDSSIKINPK